MIDVLDASFRLATPLALAALGGVLCERSGVVNIALEGILLVGAFTSVAVTFATGDPWVGALAGMAGGAALALLHAITTVTLLADQIVSGVALNLLAAGGTQFLLTVFFGSSANSPSVPGFESWDVALLRRAPPLTWIAIALGVLTHVLLFRTPFGLRLRAVGEHPLAADTVGIRVRRVRYAAVLLSGALGGLGGAFLGLETHQFVKNMAAGRGYIALAAVIFGKWTPLGAWGACLLFGAAEAVQIHLQGRGAPTQFVQMIPYVVTMLALVGVVGRSRAPGAIGRPYEGG